MKKLINIVHVRVDQNRENIWAICRMALLKRNFSLDGIFQVGDEEGFQITMKELALSEKYVLVLDKTTPRHREINWKNTSIPAVFDMGLDETEMSFEEVMEWLIEMES